MPNPSMAHGSSHRGPLELDVILIRARTQNKIGGRTHPVDGLPPELDVVFVHDEAAGVHQDEQHERGHCRAKGGGLRVKLLLMLGCIRFHQIMLYNAYII